MLHSIDQGPMPVETERPPAPLRRRASGVRREPMTDRDDAVDRADLAAIVLGDAAALERLYERHRRALYAFVRRYLGDRHLADEAVQDTLVAVWEKAETFRGEARVRTWMFGIARFRALEHRRRRRPIPIDTSAPPSRTDGASGSRRRELADVSAGPEQIAVGQDELDRVGAALARIPDDQRECFLLAVAGSLGYDEIADLLGIQVGTVKSRVSRARQRLDALLTLAERRPLAPPSPARIEDPT